MVPDSGINMEGHFAGLLLVYFLIVLFCFFASFNIHSFYFVFIRVFGSVCVLVWGTFFYLGLSTSYVQVYHIWNYNNLVDILPDQYIVAGHSRTRANHSLKFRQLPARTNCFKFSFILFPLSSRLQALTKVGYTMAKAVPVGVKPRGPLR